MSDLNVLYCAADRIAAMSLAAMLELEGWSVVRTCTSDIFHSAPTSKGEAVIALWSANTVGNEITHALEVDSKGNRRKIITVAVDGTDVPAGPVGAPVYRLQQNSPTQSGGAYRELLRELRRVVQPKATTPIRDVFVSYARKDRPFAEALIARLNALGVSTWVDLDEVFPGEDFWEIITRAIDAAHIFVFVGSANFVGSSWCLREARYAQDQHKRLIPIFLSVAKVEKVAPELARLNGIEVGEKTSTDAAINFITAALTKDPSCARPHAHFALKARDWIARDRDDEVLLRGEELADAESWLGRCADREPRPTDHHRDFIERSREVRSRRRNRRRLITSTVAVITLFGIVTSVLWRRAEDLRAVNFSRRLTTQALLQERRDVRALLAIWSGRISPSVEVDQLLRRALGFFPERLEARVLPGGVAQAGVSMQGGVAVIVDYNDTVRVFGGDGLRPVVVAPLWHRRMHGVARAVAVSKDGKRYAVARDTVLTVHDTRTNNILATYATPRYVEGIDLDYDGDIIAYRSNEPFGGGQVFVRARHGEGVRAFCETQAFVRAVALDMAGDKLACTVNDSVIWVMWLTMPLQVDTAVIPFRIRTLAFDVAGTQLAVGGGAGDDDPLFDRVPTSGSAVVWNLVDGSISEPLVHENVVVDVNFDPTGQRLVTAASDWTARVWKVPDGTEMAQLLHDGRVAVAAFGPTDDVVITFADSTLRSWRADATSVVERRTHGDSIVALGASGAGLAVVSKRGDTLLVTVDSGLTKRISLPEWRFGWSVAMNPGVSRIFVRTWDSVLIFNTSSDEWVRPPTGQRIVDVEFAHGGTVAVLRDSGKVTVVDLDSATRMFEVPAVDGATYDVAAARGHRFVAIGSGESVWVWRRGSRQRITHHTMPGRVTHLAFHPSRPVIAVGWTRREYGGLPFETHGAVTIVRVTDGTRLAELGCGAADQRLESDFLDCLGSIESLRFTAGGRWLVALAMYSNAQGTGETHNVRAWSSRTWKVRAFIEHNDGLHGFALSEDGRTMASYGRSLIRVWDVRAWTEIARIEADSLGFVMFDPRIESVLFGVIGASKIVSWKIGLTDRHPG